MEKMKELWLNKIVRIWPNDTDPKFGIVMDINAAGVTFKCLSTMNRYREKVCYLGSHGKYRFIAFSLNLTFEECDVKEINHYEILEMNTDLLSDPAVFATNEELLKQSGI